MALQPTIAVYYEHPHWFTPLFDELDRRGIPYRRLHAGRHRFDPAAPANGSPLFVNRMSPSAWLRGQAGALLYTQHLLAHLQALAAPVFNGLPAFSVETSKALQVSLLQRLGLPVPRTVVVNHCALLPEAAAALAFPVVVKPNVGGSGAGIVRFDTAAALLEAIEAGALTPGPDQTLLIQEYHPPRDGSIVRVETLEGRYLYAIRVHIAPGAGFDLCPADICRTVEGGSLEGAACPAGTEKAGLTVERTEPPPAVVAAVERIAVAARLDVGGIEYLESGRDGALYFYDINALSNFVAEPRRVVGFDPTERLVDALVARARSRS